VESNLLSKKLVDFFEKSGFVRVVNQSDGKPFEDMFKDVLNKLGISLDTQFAQFNFWSDGGSYIGKNGHELYNICEGGLDDIFLNNIHGKDGLGMPEEYIPLDSFFECEGGFFYNRKTGEVLELDLRDLKDFHAGKIKPQFKDFNTFLEWFFEVDEKHKSWED